MNERAFLFNDIIYFMILKILRNILRDSKYPENEIIYFENTVVFSKKIEESERMFHRAIHAIFEQV